MISLRQCLALGAGLRHGGCVTAESLLRRFTRRRPESNWCARLCRPLPNHSATAPEARTLTDCPRCHGDGVITIPAYAGLRRDPENDHDERCPDCAGAPVVLPEQPDRAPDTRQSGAGGGPTVE